MSEKMRITNSHRRDGLSFENFQHFVYQVKNRKKVLVYGPDYVVMSRNLYDELTRTPDPEIVFDESLAAEGEK